MNEITNHRQARLEEILLMERERYCNVVEMWGSAIDAQIQFYQDAAQTLNAQNPRWKEVGTTGKTLPQECLSFLQGVGVKERTSTAIHGYDEGYNEGYNEGYDEGYYEEGYDEGYYEEGYEEGYDEGYYEEGYEEGYYEEAYEAPASNYTQPPTGGFALPPPVPTAAPGSFKAKALYDYNGTHDYELSFAAGDTITVTQEDPATGWWTGECNGKVGPFPGNYVERI